MDKIKVLMICIVIGDNNTSSLYTKTTENAIILQNILFYPLTTENFF